MNQVLYLDGRAQPLRVGLYGVALEVAREADRLSLAPLPRLRRICCWGRVDWSGDALLACAAHAVPISFVRGGKGSAYFLPARPPARAFGALIEDACLHPDWAARLEDWTDAELRRSLMAALRTHHKMGEAVGRLLAAGDTRLAVRATLKSLGRQGPSRRVWSHLQECLHSWSVERLRSQPLFLGHFGFSSDKPNVVERLAHVVSPILLSQAVEQMDRESRRRRPGGPGDSTGTGGLAHRCALAFGHAEPAVAKRFAAAFRRFERLVRDCAEEIEP